jgi:hypothetical protein
MWHVQCKLYYIFDNGLNTADSDWQETDPTSRQRGCPTETTRQLSDRKYYLFTSCRLNLTPRHTDWLAVSRNMTLTLTLDDWGVHVRFPAGTRILYSIEFRPTHPPMQYLPGLKRLGMKLTTHLRLVPRSRMMDLYLHSPIRLHGAVLNELSIRTISFLTLPPTFNVSRCKLTSVVITEGVSCGSMLYVLQVHERVQRITQHWMPLMFCVALFANSASR